MDAAVVIPAFNERERIGTALDALRGQPATVVVVVAGDDGTADRARDHPATDVVLDDEAEAGPGPARNQGARTAAADVVCFTDADTVVGPDWVRRHLRHYEREDVVGVGGPVLALDGDRRDEFMFRALSDWWYRASWPLGFVQASSNNCSYRRSAFDAVGGFDGRLSFLEDTDLSMRMKRVGEVVYDPSARVETSVRRQREEGYLRLFLTYVRGYLRWAAGRDPDGGYFREW
jgi:GT2 family glycosyltransferase